MAGRVRSCCETKIDSSQHICIWVKNTEQVAQAERVHRKEQKTDNVEIEMLQTKCKVFDRSTRHYFVFIFFSHSFVSAHFIISLSPHSLPHFPSLALSLTRCSSASQCCVIWHCENLPITQQTLNVYVLISRFIFQFFGTEISLRRRSKLQRLHFVCLLQNWFTVRQPECHISCCDTVTFL